MTRKLIAIVVCLCVLFAALAGCSSSKIETYDDPDTAATAAATDTDDDTTAAEEDTASTAQGYAAYDPDEIVAVVEGTDVTWREYYYWLYYYSSYVEYLAASYGVTLSGWDAYELSSSYTNGEVVILNAQTAIAQYRAMETMAAEYSIALDAEDEELMESVYLSDADTYGGDGDGEATEEEIAAFEEYLDEQFMNKELYDYLNMVQLLNEDMFLALYGENGENVTDEEVQTFVDENGLMGAKHILLLTVDSSTSEALTDEEIAEKQALAEDLYAQLTAAEDQETMLALFDELMAEYTEDTGYAYYPDGYIFGEGEMVEEFETAVESLGEYELSEIVESDYGYHIILRIPVTADATYGVDSDGATYTLRYYVASEAFSSLLESYTTAAEEGAAWNDGFTMDTMDLSAIFD